MKKFINLLLVLLLVLTTNLSTTNASRSESFNVKLTSTPRAKVIPGGESTVKLRVGDTITFRRTISSNGVDNFSWAWNWNRGHLSCRPTPDFDSPRMRCTVRKAGTSTFSITMFPQFSSGSTGTIESNQIFVTSTR
jgi:hypothetical protein